MAVVAGIHVVMAQPASPGRPGAQRPGIRTDHAVGYYDPERKRVMIVGDVGDPKEGERDKVWSWNGVAWDLETDQGPPGRVNAAAAYDARGRSAVVVGGSRKSADGATWSVVGDTWRRERGDWRRLIDVTPIDHQALAVDRRGRLLMYGGIPTDRGGPWPSDTWALDGDRWSRVTTDGPPGRGRTAMVYDSRRSQIVLFGGASAPPPGNLPQTFFDDTWTWDGDRWRQAAAKGPRGRYAHGMVFDERAGVVILYSGAGAHRDAPLSDMWQWDGRAWTEIRLTGPTPGYRYQPILVYDRGRGTTLLYGGIGGASDTWEWDGRQWKQVAS